MGEWIFKDGSWLVMMLDRLVLSLPGALLGVVVGSGGRFDSPCLVSDSWWVLQACADLVMLGVGDTGSPRAYLEKGEAALFV